MTNRTMAQVFRAYAAQEQAYANEARFPSARAIHEAAARKWLLLAEQSESPGPLPRATSKPAGGGDAGAGGIDRSASGPKVTLDRSSR